MTADFARAQMAMIESQIRTNDVTDPDILAAFRAVERQRHTPSALAAVAYADTDLELAPGRFALRPRDFAKLLQALSPKPKDRVLEIGAGLGYGSAILGHLCASVIALEPDPELARAAVAALAASPQGAELAKRVQVVTTNPQFGWADGGPFDVILVQGGAEIVPEVWFEQLADGGRLGVIVRTGAAGSARVYIRSGKAIAYRTVFDAAPPVLFGLEGPRGFAF